MRYIRTKDNKIFDLEDIKKRLAIESAYPHLKAWKLEPANDQRGALRLSWIAFFNKGEAKVSGYVNNRECAIILDCESSEYQEADTIEKLCDYWDFYSCLNEEYEIKPTYILTPHILYLDLQRGYIKDVKLCIRTDKGLIYVAKMNDKGELELL